MSEVFHPLVKKDFQKFATHTEPHSVSIYLPMFKRGKEQNQGISEAHLKSCIREVHGILLAQGMSEKVAGKYLKPIKELVEDIAIWRNPSEGMVIFLSKEMGMQYYKLPIKFNVFAYVSDHHYLLPLLSLYSNDSSFYLLELSQDHVKLFEGNMFEMEDLFVSELAPERLEEAVGFDYEQKMLQFRSGHSLYSQGAFHGHGEGKDDERKEVSNFFREINKGVVATIQKKNAPLILACVDWLYPLYKEVNTYPNLHPDYISGDPEFKNTNEMHKQAWSLIQDLQSKMRDQKADRYEDLIHTAKTSHQISEIVPAAVHGKIDTLFVSKNEEVYGTFNPNKDCVIIDSEKTAGNLSLPNLAAMNTFLKGGTVFSMEADKMPFKKRPLNALLRY